VILVFCPNGHVFESRAFSFEGNIHGLTLKGNWETCPICGAMAEIMDGEFDVIDGVVRLLAAPQTTLDRLQRLRELLQNLRAENASPEQAAEVLEAEAPGLARLLPRNRAEFLAVLAILLTVIAILVGHYDATHQKSGLTDNDVTKIIKEVIDHQQQSPTTSPPPQTPPPP
jgi:hypothetical protein